MNCLSFISHYLVRGFFISVYSNFLPSRRGSESKIKSGSKSFILIPPDPNYCVFRRHNSNVCLFKKDYTND